MIIASNNIRLALHLIVNTWSQDLGSGYNMIAEKFAYDLL